MVQHSQPRKRGQGKYQKFHVGHWNIPMPGLSSSSQTSQIAQQTGSCMACCPEPWPEPQPERNWDYWDENRCGTFIKIFLNLRNVLTGLKELVNFSDLGYLPQQKVNQGTRDDHRLCYNQVIFITFAHTRKECNSSTCYLPGMVLYGINVM